MNTIRLVIAAALSLAASSAAAQLRLQDVFSGDLPTSAPVVTLADLDRDPAMATELIQEVEQHLEVRDNEAALQKTELLLAWLRRGAPEYERVLWLRGRAFAALEDDARLAELCRQYLAQYPEGSYRLWFLMQVARQLQRQGKLDDAAAVWALVARQEVVPAPEEALEGAAVLNRAGNAEAARSLLREAFASNRDSLSPQTLLERDLMLVDSLLIRDDDSVVIPPPAPGQNAQEAGYNLRRAMLLELRGEADQARAAYQALRAQRHLLKDEERDVLESHK